MIDLRFWLDRTNQVNLLIDLTKANLLNPNQSNRRSPLQWYLHLQSYELSEYAQLKLTLTNWLQRPTAKELLRHPFIKKAKRNNHLIDLIDRFRKWKLTHSADSDSESDSDADQANNSDDSDWNLTVKGSVSPYIEEFSNNVVILDKDDDKKTSLMVTAAMTSTTHQNNVIDLNRDVIEVKNNHHHRSVVSTSPAAQASSANGSKLHNGSGPSPHVSVESVISPKRQQTSQHQQQQTSSPIKSSPHRASGQHRSSTGGTPASTPAAKSELNIVSWSDKQIAEKAIWIVERSEAQIQWKLPLELPQWL